MAGDWIKLRCNLIHDPAVIAISEATGIDPFGVVGRLHALWSWADQQLRNSNGGVTPMSWIDNYVCAPGFAEAMVAAGWLEKNGRSFSLPNWERHNGTPAKIRALGAKRQAEFRQRTSNAKRNASVTQGGLPREEKNNPPKSPQGGTAGKQVSRKAETQREPAPVHVLEAFKSPAPLPGESMEQWRNRIHKARAEFARERTHGTTE